MGESLESESRLILHCVIYTHLWTNDSDHNSTAFQKEKS